MSASLRIAIGLAACAWTFAAGAQDCAQKEKQVAAQPPLTAAALLVAANCLAGKDDAAAIAKSVRRLVGEDKGEATKPQAKPEPKDPEKEAKSAAQELAETPQIAERALGEVASYVDAARQALPSGDAARSARIALAGLLAEIEATRKTIAQRLPLGVRDTKGWEWDGDRAKFPGLALDLSPLDKDCAQAGDACGQSREAAKAALRAGHLVNRSLAYADRDRFDQALAAARLRDAKWTSYFDDTRLQLPLELAFNGLLHGLANRSAGGFADVPNSQWILLHPGVGMEYVSGAQAGNRFEPSLLIEVIGYNRWSWSKEGKAENALGASLIYSYSDRVGMASGRPGVMVHFLSKYSLAYTRNSGKNGFVLSVDLAKLVTKVEDTARSDFRLKGTGRTSD